MTVSSSLNKNGPYSGNDVTTVFARTFLVIDAAHLKVYATTAGVTTEVTTGITKDGIGTTSGNVTFSVAPATGTDITLVREVPITQLSDYSNQGKVKPEQVEDDLDLQVMQAQDIDEKVSRSLKASVTSGALVDLPPIEEGKVLIGNVALDGFDIGPSASEISAASGSAAAAAASAAAALVSEGNAATSETNAGVSETNAAASKAAAAISETNAGTSETNAATSAGNALTSAGNAATSETNAGISAGNAATSETNAGISETNASNSAAAALVSEGNAGTSETNAAASAAAAAADAAARFNTRAEFIAADLSGLSNGDKVLVLDGLYSFAKLTGATTIADKADFIPVAPWRSEHYGIVLDNVTDQTTKLQALLDYAAANGSGIVTLERDDSTSIAINGSVTIPSGIILEGQTNKKIDTASNPTFTFTATGAGFTQLGGSRIQNILFKSNVVSYAGPALNLSDSTDANIGDPIQGDNIGFVGDSSATGTAIKCVDKVTFASYKNLHFKDFDKGIEVVPAAGTEWFNSNIFKDMLFDACEYCVHLDNASGAGIDGNTFHGAVQSDATMARVLYANNADNNTFDIFVWDKSILVADGTDAGPIAMEFRGTSKGNVVYRSTPPEFITDDNSISLYAPNTFYGGNNQPIAGTILPHGRYGTACDLHNDNLAFADQKYTVVDNSTSGTLSNIFDRDGHGGSLSFAIADGWGYVAVDLGSAGILTNIRQMAAVFTQDAPIECQFWYSNLANPDETNTADWTALGDPFVGNTRCIFGDHSQTVVTARHVMVRFYCQNGTTVLLQDFAGYFPLLTERAYLSVAGGTVYGDMSVSGKFDVDTTRVTLSSRLNLGSNNPERTISSGAITLTSSQGSLIDVDTEADAATDDLDTISGGGTGDVIILRAESSARTVVVKHNTGNIRLDGNADKSLTQANDRLTLIFDGSNWLQLAFSDNST